MLVNSRADKRCPPGSVRNNNYDHKWEVISMLQLRKKTDSTGTAVKQPLNARLAGKGKLIAGVCLAAVLAAFFLLPRGAKANSAVLDLSGTFVLEYTDVESSISATGTVESAKSMTVYSTMAYTVQEVLVEVGDYVEEGQLLARLDGQNILDSIESQEASLSVSSSTSAASIASAKDNYEQYKATLEEGLNSTILSAESAVTNAYNSYVSAVNTYERYKEGLDEGENTTLLSQEASLRSARTALENAQENYTNTQEDLYDAEDGINDAQAELADAEDDLYDAEDDLADAEDRLDRCQRELSRLGGTDYTARIGQLQTTLTTLASQLEAEADPAVQAQLQGQIAAAQAELEQLTAVQADAAARQAALTQEVTQLTSTVAKLEGAVASAEAAVTAAEAKVDQAVATRDAYQRQLTTAERTVGNATESYAAAIAQYNAAVTGVDNALADYATAVETAYTAYQTAQTNLQAANLSAQNQLEAYRNNLNSAYASANKAVGETSLRQLRADLDSTEITAPTAGTVTAVYAKVGAAGSGLLFVIEDVDDLVVESSVKEYDVGSVRLGMKASVSADAVKGKEIEGEITSIAPTANKTSLGVTDTTGDAVYATEVKITTPDTGLKIGMEAQLDYIIERQERVLAVPYYAVYENGEGTSCVIGALEQEDGTYLLTEIPVTTGMDDDLEIVISGEGVAEGLRVIKEADEYRHLIGQALPAGKAPTGMEAMMAARGGM